MKILDLFAGSCSVRKAAQRFGATVYAVDYKPFDGIDLVIDIEDLTPEMIPFKPDMVWVSPPCPSYSIAGFMFHRNEDRSLKTAFAEKSDRLVKHTLELLKYWGAPYYLENPRGLLRKMPFMLGIDRGTVCYCQYGDTVMKPTDIFTNNLRSLFKPNGWNPRPMCYNNNPHCHHERSPRGCKTSGTQKNNHGIKVGGVKNRSNAYLRSIVPPDLIKEVILATIQKKNNKKQSFLL